MSATTARRYRITWEGGELGVVTAISPERAIARFLEVRGYGYMTPFVLAAEEVAP